VQVAETSFEDTNNEHSLLESNELRIIGILKGSVKCLQVQPNVVRGEKKKERSET
jgi:hypothetical protein